MTLEIVVFSTVRGGFYSTFGTPFGDRDEPIFRVTLASREALYDLTVRARAEARRRGLPHVANLDDGNLTPPPSPRPRRRRREV